MTAQEIAIFSKAYEEHFSKAYYPIGFVTENDTHWAVFSNRSGDDFSTWVPLVNKETGQITHDFFADYIYLPRVSIPEKYRTANHEARRPHHD